MAYPRSSRPLANSVALLVLAALAVTVSGAGADIVNLVQNPGFERPNIGWSWWVTGGFPLYSWDGGDQRELVTYNSGPSPHPHGGAQSLGLNGWGGSGWISQNLATVAGGTYDLSFFMSGCFFDQGANDTTRTLEVFWSGASLGPVVFTRPSDWAANNMGWTLQSGGVLSGLTASGPWTQLKFVSLNPGYYGQGSALDDVSVIATPEPGSLSLLLLALPGLVWLRRRRRA